MSCPLYFTGLNPRPIRHKTEKCSVPQFEINQCHFDVHPFSLIIHPFPVPGIILILVFCRKCLAVLPAIQRSAFGCKNITAKVRLTFGSPSNVAFVSIRQLCFYISNFHTGCFIQRHRTGTHRQMKCCSDAALASFFALCFFTFGFFSVSSSPDTFRFCRSVCEIFIESITFSV